MHPPPKYLLTCLAFLSYVSVALAESPSQEVLRFVAGKYSDYKIEQLDSGDLDGDGNSEIAMLLGNQKNNQQRLLVVRQDVSGFLTLLSASKDFYRCMHGYEIAIVKKSLLIDCFHGGGHAASALSNYQFSLRNNRLRLIGETSSLSPGPDEQPDSEPSVEKSTNYLTGQSIQVKKLKGRTLSREQKSLSPAERQPRYLDDFEP